MDGPLTIYWSGPFFAASHLRPTCFAPLLFLQLQDSHSGQFSSEIIMRSMILIIFIIVENYKIQRRTVTMISKALFTISLVEKFRFSKILVALNDHRWNVLFKSLERKYEYMMDELIEVFLSLLFINNVQYNLMKTITFSNTNHCCRIYCTRKSLSSVSTVQYSYAHYSHKLYCAVLVSWTIL